MEFLIEIPIHSSYEREGEREMARELEHMLCFGLCFVMTVFNDGLIYFVGLL